MVLIKMVEKTPSLWPSQMSHSLQSWGPEVSSVTRLDPSTHLSIHPSIHSFIPPFIHPLLSSPPRCALTKAGQGGQGEGMYLTSAQMTSQG